MILGGLPVSARAGTVEGTIEGPVEEEADVGLRAREILAREDFQTEPVEIEGDPGAARADGRPWRDRRSPPRAERWDDPAGAALSQVLLWAGLVVAAIGAIAWSSRQLKRSPTADATLDPREEAPLPAPAPLGAQPSADARELARAGRFTEALRALLHDTTRALGRSQRLRIPASLTSREIARRLEFDGPSRASYDALVALVESSTFGTRSPTADDWEHAVARYRVLRESWQTS